MARKTRRTRKESDGAPKRAGADSKTKRASKDGSEKPKESSLRETVKTVVIAVILFILIRTFILQTFVITSGSMEDALLVGDFLMVNRVAVGARIPFTEAHLPGYSEIQRGDVLVFDPHHEPDLKLVKRLVGMPGDTLEMRDRILYRNGDPLDEPYVKVIGRPDDMDPRMGWQRDHLLDEVSQADYRPTRDTWGPLVVPEGHYFMLGDNRDNSQDSRYWGPLAEWRIEGRVSFIYFSYNRDSFRPFAFLREIRWGRIASGVD